MESSQRGLSSFGALIVLAIAVVAGSPPGLGISECSFGVAVG